MRKTVWLYLLCISALLLLQGCNPFAPQKSEAPVQPVPWHTFFIEVDSTLENLKFCYNYPQNALKYGYILSPDFVYHFAAQDISDYGVPTTWNATSEKDMLINLHKTFGVVGKTIHLDSLSVIAGQSDQITTYTAWVYRTYKITVTGSAKTTSIYRGKCTFYLEYQDGLWYIKDWYDYKLPSYTTWGKLKYDYSL